jgi:acyl-CoA thioesterase
MFERDESSDARRLAEAAVRAMYERDSASQALGMRIVEVRPGYARVTMGIRENMVNGHQICHGGLIFTLADSSFAFACNSHNCVTVAAGGTIEFLLAVRLGDDLIATAQERSRSRRTGIYDVDVRNQKGECVAMFRGRSHELGGEVVDSSTLAGSSHQT